MESRRALSTSTWHVSVTSSSPTRRSHATCSPYAKRAIASSSDARVVRLGILAVVVQIVFGLPALAAVLRILGVLSDGLWIDRREGEAVQRERLRVIPDEEREALPVELTRAILRDLAVLADPELLPLLDGRVIGVETFAMSAAATRPVFE